MPMFHRNRQHKFRYLLAIPVFNEAPRLTSVLREARLYARDILVIDDGSTDATPDLLRQEKGIHKIRHPENRGYGQSLIDAFQFAIDRDYDWLITMDCDEQHEPHRIPDFLEAAERDDADIISGSRYMQEMADNSMPPADRRKINRTITDRLNRVLELELTDSFCGFKAYRVEALKKLNITVPGYAMPLQFWVQAVRKNLRIREIPIRLIYNDLNRHFGGELDDPDVRLQHYYEVLARELKRSITPTKRCPVPCICCEPDLLDQVAAEKC